VSTWIVLRGLMRESRHWGRFPDAFRAALPEAELHLLDLPGNGRLRLLRSHATIAALAASCRAEAAARALAPPYRVLALSLGAMVAGEWARAYPREIAGAVLVSASMRPFSPFYRRLLPCHYPALLRLASVRSDPALLERWILDATANDPRARDAVFDEWVRLQRDCPVSTANALRQLLAAARYRASPQPPPVPLLLICGDGDRLVDPRCSLDLSAAWRVPLARHPRAGHDVALDAPFWLAEQVRAWLAASSSCHTRAL
jgi:pimeloyl-ACP methyl ester carboxylesterase